MLVQGQFPRSWKLLLPNFLENINISNNVGLFGCVPVYTYASVYFSPNSGITGPCNFDAVKIEQRQCNAMLTILPKVVGNVYSTRWYNITAQVGSALGDEVDNSVIKVVGDVDGEFIELAVDDGTEYVLSLSFKGAPLNLRKLV